MLDENIRTLRKSRGLSQDELAAKLNVVRQTVSKWERGLSVPDADMLVALGEALDAPVGTLLGDAAKEPDRSDVEKLAAKLEVTNLQLARMRESRRRTARGLLVAAAACIALTFAAFVAVGESYLAWDLADPESAVAATLLHGFEWTFVRAAPFAFVGAVAGAIALGRQR